jgi:DNA-3-methyladenine glycosylase
MGIDSILVFELLDPARIDPELVEIGRIWRDGLVGFRVLQGLGGGLCRIRLLHRAALRLLHPSGFDSSASNWPHDRNQGASDPRIANIARIIQGIGSRVSILKRTRARRAVKCAFLTDTPAVSFGRPHTQRFYARDSRAVAPELIGCRLVHRLSNGERLVVRITEVEAYLGDGTDPASHAHPGPTKRNQTMFGPPARLYAYRSYGIHTCVNVVCQTPGWAAAVLLRAGEPLEGQATMRRHRGLSSNAKSALISVGPGRLAQALGLRLEDDGRSLLRGSLTLHSPDANAGPIRVERGPRVGITKAADLPYRFFESESPWVSAFRRGGKKRPPRP